MKIKKILSNIMNNIISFYTSGTVISYIAIGVTSIIGIGAALIGSVALITSLTKDPEPTTVLPPTTYLESTTEEQTTLIQTTEPTVETTSEEITTEETTVIETTTIPETTTPPPTIAKDDLDIGSAEEEATAETTRKVSQEFFEEEEETEKPTEKPTQKPSESSTQKPTEKPSEKPTEPPTEPPVSEYACVVKGIDVSKWNSLDKKAIDWTKVKNSGVEYVIIRAGYRGQTTAQMYEDPYFKTHIEGALSAGLQVGVYFYSQAITEQEALEEASFLLSIIKGYKLTYPVCFDWEPVSGSRAGEAKLSKEKASAIARKFLSTIEGYGYEGMLYSYHSAIKTYWNAQLTNDFKVWMAYYFKAYNGTGVEYKAGDKLPSTSYPFQMWQYSSTGTVPGIQGVVDMNVSFFSYSGSGVPSSPIVINLPATSYTTNIGVSVDYKTGVKSFNTAGIDVSSAVTTTIKNSSGVVVTEEDAFNTAGKYTITYTIKDFTGVSKSAIATLIVRGRPAITVSNDVLTFNRQITILDNILEELMNNIISITDYEGNVIDPSNVIITGLESLTKPSDEPSSEPDTSVDSSDEETTSTSSSETTTTPSEEGTSTSTEDSTDILVPSYVNGLALGSYEITYKVIDQKDCEGTLTITVTITDGVEDESDENESDENESDKSSSNENESNEEESNESETTTKQ